MKQVSLGKAVCIAVVICWMSLMAVIWYGIQRCQGVAVHKTVDVTVEVNK